MSRPSVEQRIRRRLFRKMLPGYAMFFAALGAIGFLYGNPVGMVLLFIAFAALRYEYNGAVTYHNDSSKKCLALSVLLFAVAGIPLILLEIRFSLLACVPVGLAATWVLHIAGAKEQAESKAKELEAERAAVSQAAPEVITVPLKTNPGSRCEFDIDRCTPAQLYERCCRVFKSDVERKWKRAHQHFIEKLPHKLIDANPRQSQMERMRMRKVLMKSTKRDASHDAAGKRAK